MIQNVNDSNKPEFSTIDSVIAWFCLIVSYIFCRVFFVEFKSLGCFVLIISVYVFTIIALKFKGYKFNILPTLCAVVAMVMSVGIILFANEFLNTLIFIFVVINYFYFVYSSTDNNIKGLFSEYIFADLLKALFVLPFSSFGDLFKVCSSGKAKGFSKTLAKIIIGIAIAIIPTVIVFSLLSYDNNFTAIVKNIFNFSFHSVFMTMVSLFFTAPFSLYLFGLFSSSFSKKCSHILSEEKCEKIKNQTKVAYIITALSATIPLLLIYVIFFVSQFEYYLSAFSGVLPKEFSYAEYAREGFFQLCAVSLINLIVLILVIMLVKTDSKVSKILLKMLCITFSVFTLVLIATAVSKMLLYINSYGLTQKRVYATWFMAVIAMIFICIIAKQLCEKFKLIATCVAIFVVLFFGLSISNIDTQIAKYNVNRYISGSVETIDLEMLFELGESSVEQLVRLSEEFEKIDVYSTDDETDDYLKESLNLKLTELAQEQKTKEQDFLCYNYTRYKAKRAILKWSKEFKYVS